MTERDIVFFSYNHDDSRWFASIRAALEPYVLDQKLKVWSDRDIAVGNRWHDVIQNQLPRTRVAILLISQRFFASKYIREDELPRLLEDAAKDQLALVCVSVGEAHDDLIHDRGLASYQFAVEPERPLSARRGNQREKAIVAVAIAVAEAYGRGGPEPDKTARTAIGYREAQAIESVATSGKATDRQPPARLFSVPDLDRHYVERTELDDLRQLVLGGTELAAGVTSAGRSGRFGLHGMGGMGKTVLAQAFCHDAAVQQAFPDGIYWLTLGQEPALIAEQTRLLRMIDPETPVIESSNHARDLLRARLAGKRVLLIIDDLWHADHFRAFDVVNGQSRVLITTRDAGILTVIGAREQSLDRLNEAQSLRLIAEWAGLPSGHLPDVAKRVAQLCGYLPLALALAGAQIADGLRWETLVEQIERGRVEFLDHEYGSVFDSLGRSVDALSDFERARYLELALFAEDARIPPQTIARLWKHSGGLAEAESEKLIARLQRKALLKRMQTPSGQHISFHDLQYDFVRLRADSPRALSSLLLDAYRTTLELPDGAIGWSKLPADEPYMWGRLASHLVEAGREAELNALLLSIDWVRARLNASTILHGERRRADVNALLADYDLGTGSDVLLVQRALRMSAHVLGPNPEQVAFQLFGRLGTSNAPALQVLCERALKHGERDALIPMRPALSVPSALVFTLAGHGGWVSGATLLPDGRRALSWSEDRTLRLWDLAKGRLISSYFADATLCSPAVDQRRSRIFAGDRLGRIHIIRLSRNPMMR